MSISRACKCVLLAKSIYYCIEIVNARIRYGFRRISTLIRREGFDDKQKRIYRIYKEEGLNLRRKRSRRDQSVAHRLERVENSSIHKVRSMDFLQDSLYNGSKFRILRLVDNFSKKCLSLFVGKSLKGGDVVE